MASDPLPSASNEVGEDAALPSNAEDRKAAEAMSKLEDRGDDHDDGSARKEVDAEALGKAMKNLAIGGEALKAAELKKKVKVEAADVTLVMDELDMSKAKATDLLRAHDGDPAKAMTAYVMAPLPPPRIIT